MNDKLKSTRASLAKLIAQKDDDNSAGVPATTLPHKPLGGGHALTERELLTAFELWLGVPAETLKMLGPRARVVRSVTLER